MRSLQVTWRMQRQVPPTSQGGRPRSGECGLVSPLHRRPGWHVEQTQPEASGSLNGKTEQSRAHIWPGRSSLHYTPSESPFQPCSLAELRGSLTQALWGVPIPAREDTVLFSSASIPQSSSLCLLSGSALSVTCTLGVPSVLGPLSTEDYHLPLSRS